MINRLYTNYIDAENDCDTIAGDNQLHMVVVERFDLESPEPGHRFAAVVINHNDLDGYIAKLEDDMFEIVYESDQTPEAQAQRG